MRTVNLKKLREIGAKKHLLIISLGVILMIAVFSISISNEIAKLNLEYDLEDGNFWYYKSSKNRIVKKALFDDNSLSLSYREKSNNFLIKTWILFTTISATIQAAILFI